MITLKQNHNPDVLNCLANLSNDEIFTPTKIANAILDTLPKNIWSNSNIKFLDPVCKTGIFLREIASRLNIGLKKTIPDDKKRANHIFTKQIFGIAITELTSLMTRRTLYYSRNPLGNNSICKNFKDKNANIFFKNNTHTWDKNDSCEYCGAKKIVYDRGVKLETYVYPFLHTNEIFENMKFDVIIGNPPYQLEDGGFGKSASPIYHKFVEQAIRLNPTYLTMIIPARWYSGGKGLDEFRDKMLNDERISEIHDFPSTSDCFPGLNIRGGVCYFLWDKNHKGKTKIFNYKDSKIISITERELKVPGADIFVRYNESISILEKVQKLNEKSFEYLVSSRKPFGLPTNFTSFQEKKTDKFNIKLYRFGEDGYINEMQTETNRDLIYKYKILVPKASPGGDEFPHQVLSKPIISIPGSCCTETYIVIGPFKDKATTENVVTYIKTKFFRFLILLIKNTQDVTRRKYFFIPDQDFKSSWDDKKLYKKYNINDQEIKFIESLVRPLE